MSMDFRTAAATPWLSVIMPTHCGELWIDVSLRSLVAEASEGIEILVIDSSPTPATLDIARSYSDRLHLHVFERRDLPTWPAKTNFGVEVAASSYICWLHQDDLWLPGRAAAVRAWIEAAPEAPLHLARARSSIGVAESWAYGGVRCLQTSHCDRRW